MALGPLGVHEMMRKNTRFRLYLWCLSFLYVSGFSFLLWRQSSLNQKRFSEFVSSYEDRFVELSSSLRSSSEASSVSSSVSSSSEASSDDPPEYFVLGSGQGPRYGYIDILFLDGSKNRYYFRKHSRSDLDFVVQSIERDRFLKKWNIVSYYDSSFEF